MYSCIDYYSYANRLWEVGSGGVIQDGILTYDVTDVYYGSCTPCELPDIVTGCTDENADNYNDAIFDDGSCFTTAQVVLTTMHTTLIF